MDAYLINARGYSAAGRQPPNSALEGTLAKLAPLSSALERFNGNELTSDTSGFMHRYYDWADFERFVEDIYQEDGNVVVERNVTEIDLYGAKRQTDIKITRQTKFHQFITLVECKRWKEPVSRDRVDVLAASIEALGATNGAIFTPALQSAPA